MGTYRDLLVWKRAMDLVTVVYRATEGFPAHERYGLTNQLRRAAVAIPSDIAEGKGRTSRREYIQMLARARGSTFEVQTQLEISRSLGFLTRERADEAEEKAAEVGRLLNALIQAIQRRVDDETAAGIAQSRIRTRRL